MEKRYETRSGDLFVELKSEQGYQKTSNLIESNLEELNITIENNFLSLSTQVYDCVQNPYSESAGLPVNLTLQGEEELCELQCDRTL